MLMGDEHLYNILAASNVVQRAGVAGAGLLRLLHTQGYCALAGQHAK
jgi:hypothetical protein